MKFFIKRIIKTILKRIFPELYHSFKLNLFIRKNLPREFVEHLNVLSKDHFVIDVGAKIGMVSECLAKKGAKVISFEPNRKAYTELSKVAKKYNNIDVKNLAVGTKDKIVNLYMHKETRSSTEDLTQASSLLVKKPNISSCIFEEVQEIDFAEYLKSLQREIELIKIDIEGYEIQLINHLLDKESLDNVKKIYLETHEKKFTQLVKPTLKLKERIKSEGLEEKFCYDWP